MSLSCKAFNVTLIHPATYVHSLALSEAADYVEASLRACGYQSLRTTNQILSKAHNIVFCAHLLQPEHLGILPPDTIIFNSEQLDDDTAGHFRGIYPQLLDRYFVWDYSSDNLGRIPHDRKSVIPFLHCQALRRFAGARRHGKCLLFYGSTTPRRQKILAELQESGLPVQAIFGEYGAERDLRLLAAWAVLNLHKYDTTASFEPMRCFYPLINHVPVISEDSGDASTDAYRDAVFFFDRASLVQGIVGLYRDQHSFATRSAAMLAAFQQKLPLGGFVSAVERFLNR